MTHFAVAEALEGNSVTWMEKVTDEEYAVEQAID
jgi:4-carboxymuconolactone decarboxylase